MNNLVESAFAGAYNGQTFIIPRPTDDMDFFSSLQAAGVDLIQETGVIRLEYAPVIMNLLGRYLENPVDIPVQYNPIYRIVDQTDQIAYTSLDAAYREIITKTVSQLIAEGIKKEPVLKLRQAFDECPSITIPDVTVKSGLSIDLPLSRVTVSDVTWEDVLTTGVWTISNALLNSENSLDDACDELASLASMIKNRQKKANAICISYPGDKEKDEDDLTVGFAEPEDEFRSRVTSLLYDYSTENAVDPKLVIAIEAYFLKFTSAI